MRSLILIFIFCSSAVFAEVDTRQISSKPKEIYGTDHKNIGLTIANGGAGPTGILRALAEDYLEKSDAKYSIAWYQDISTNSLKHLKNGTIDVALVYEKSEGDVAQKEGWATNYAIIFNDHFLIVGPKKNPANLAESDSPTEAFLKISDFGKKNSGKIFLSRSDESGTNIKEKSIWRSAKLEPWSGNESWYFKYPTFPKTALLYVDQHELYSITDWGTWLSSKGSLKNSKIYLSGGEDLLNPCFALLGKKPRKEALEFLEYLKSPRAQKLIANFGKDKHGGLAFFTEAAQMDFK
ncbi:MAG: substrate-binding domain-containing protein [Proteobacteria bacterium]|nr:substrate-binding domain-containing protein [Pseudomonadota bacterium]